jgi:hypothetical protein
MGNRRRLRRNHALAASSLLIGLFTLGPTRPVNAAPAVVTAPSTTCALAADGGVRRYYFEPVQASGTHYPLDMSHRIGNNRYGFQTSQSIAGNPLPAGRYAVTLGSFDPHHPVAPGRTTPGEQWRAEFYAGGAKVAQTTRTPDLPDNTKGASFDMGIEDIGSNVTLLKGVYDPSNPSDRHAFSPWFAEFRCA